MKKVHVACRHHGTTAKILKLIPNPQEPDAEAVIHKLQTTIESNAAFIASTTGWQGMKNIARDELESAERDLLHWFGERTRAEDEAWGDLTAAVYGVKSYPPGTIIVRSFLPDGSDQRVDSVWVPTL